MRFHKSYVSGQYLSFFFLLAHSLKKIIFLLILSFVFFLVVFLVADFVSAASGHGVMYIN